MKNKSREHEPDGRFTKTPPGEPHRWKKGESGNPSGRRSHRQLTEALKAELAKGDTAIEIIRKVVSLAKGRERWAVELIFDRVEGKAHQPVDIYAELVAQASEAGIPEAEAIAIAEEIIKERGL